MQYVGNTLGLVGDGKFFGRRNDSRNVTTIKVAEKLKAAKTKVA